ncbi:putrescine aminotransferase [Salinimicrobium catena]|uniref:Putrescine aminotransferase n=1 Tax=Salinimicrobium catena TaxID=390640 RepID=A0A1H5P2J7_9FLAO|nr:aspartate aminotransferase family protein [Salinimicrobium catena]SDL68246.1 putrescine aminotransferase [Salinimicrobium catena]SEF08096.1 putrescine aminotransferase [Salinimicrobium catena]
MKENAEKYFGRGNESFDLEIVKAEGSFVYDASGKRYIDFLGGAGVGSLGWDHPKIEEAIRHQQRPTYVYPNFHYKGWNELAELLAGITPGKLEKSFRMTGGSEAVEAALEMAMMYTGRKKIVSMEGSYHGNTLGALSIGATSKQENFPNLLSGCEKIEPPLNEDRLEEVEKMLSTEEFSAVIMEPIIINLGVVIPEAEFMAGLDRLCKKYGTVLIMDEAITGFGRTGKMFATEHYDIEPDILCMAKAITAGHAGMGAVITTREIASKIEGKIGLYSSYGWHPLSVDASIATINYLQENRKGIFENIRQLSSLFQKELAKLNFRNKPELRIKGLAIGIDLHDADYASKVKAKALKEGLLMNTEGSALLFLPNFLMKEQTAREGIELLKKCI